jgi:hypothetical protein
MALWQFWLSLVHLLSLTKHLAESNSLLKKRGKAAAPPEDLKTLAGLNWTKVACYPRGPGVFKSSVPPVTLWPIDRESCNIRHRPTKPLRGKLISVSFNSHGLYSKYHWFSRFGSSRGCSANTVHTNSLVMSLKVLWHVFCFFLNKFVFGEYVYMGLKVKSLKCSQITKLMLNIYALEPQINPC